MIFGVEPRRGDLRCSSDGRDLTRGRVAAAALFVYSLGEGDVTQSRRGLAGGSGRYEQGGT
jgi:hypothetical protein